MKTRTREQRLGIQTEKHTDHRAYFTELSNALGIKWPDDEKTFMRRTVETWSKLYDEDKYLNNVALQEFDNHYPLHCLLFGKYGWSMSDTVSCLKTVIINKIHEYRKENQNAL